MAEIALPQSDKRTAVIGSTGTGKTQFGIWLLSRRDFNLRPWYIFDFKGDKLISEIGATEIAVTSNPPKEPGLYVIRPLPNDGELVSAFFYKCWQQENCGIFVDEGYMIPKNCNWFRACLTQGRSKDIEMIILSQRPVFMDKFVFTEANFFAIFALNYKGDRQKVNEYLGEIKFQALPKYHCLWYSVDGRQATVFQPVPDAKSIVKAFQQRLAKKRAFI